MTTQRARKIIIKPSTVRAPNNAPTHASAISSITHSAKVALLGNYMAASFVTVADGHGGTLVTEAAQTANQLVPLATPHTG